MGVVAKPMKQVWEYYLPVVDDFILGIPFTCKFLELDFLEKRAGDITRIPVLWVLVDPKMEKIRHKFKWFKTGDEILGSDDTNAYIGTIQWSRGIPFHLFWVGYDEYPVQLQQKQQEAITSSTAISTGEKQKGVPSTSD